MQGKDFITQRNNAPFIVASNTSPRVLWQPHARANAHTYKQARPSDNQVTIPALLFNIKLGVYLLLINYQLKIKTKSMKHSQVTLNAQKVNPA